MKRLACFLGLLLSGAGPITAQQSRAPAPGAKNSLTKQVGFDQKLGRQLPLDLPFRDDDGRALRLGELCGRRPVLLVPVYYRCPLLCSQVLNGLVRSLKPVRATAGKEFDVVAFSIDPEETPQVAGPKKAAYLERYERPGSAAGWHFLTGTAGSIRSLSEAIGFRYTYNPQTKLYTHAAGLVIATPEGRIARYMYGIDYPPRELEREIDQARAGRIGAPIARLLLLCYDYDSATGKYTLSILRLLRVLGTATALGLGGFLVIMLRRERRAAQSAVCDSSWEEFGG
jgi:protein SCO1